MSWSDLAAEALAFARSGQRAGPVRSRPASTSPRTYAACPACCMSSSSTDTSRTASVTGGVQRVSTTRGRSASVTPDTSFTVCACVAS